MKQSEIKAGRTYQGPSRHQDCPEIRRRVVSVDAGVVRWHYSGDSEKLIYRNFLSTFASWAKSEVKWEGV